MQPRKSGNGGRVAAAKLGRCGARWRAGAGNGERRLGTARRNSWRGDGVRREAGVEAVSGRIVAAANRGRGERETG